MIALVLALGWGALAGLPFVVVGERLEASGRARDLRRVPAARRGGRLARRVQATLVARVVAGIVRARRARRHRELVRRDLPVAVDLVGVAIGAGCTPWQALHLAVRFSPPVVARPLDRALQETAVGSAFDVALEHAGAREPVLAPLTDVLRTSARSGAPIAASLVRVAGEVRADIRRRAEARARTVPVRLLFPLVFCALPAFALLTVVPVIIEGFRF